MPPIIFHPEEEGKADLLLSRVLRRFIRFLALCALMFGLYTWAILLDWFDDRTLQFSHLGEWHRGQVIFFAFGSVIVASGLAHSLAWGLVVWLFCNSLLIVLGLLGQTPFGSGLIVFGISLALLIVYGALMVLEELAQRKHAEQEEAQGAELDHWAPLS